MSVIFADFGTARLSAPFSADSTVLSVSDASRLPVLSGADYFYLVLQAYSDKSYVEVVKCVSISGGNLTVERGSVRKAFSVGDYVENRLTLDGLRDAVHQWPSIQVADYAALRAYTGTLGSVYVTGVVGTANPEGIAGAFVLAANDHTRPDNGGTIIVDALGRRWIRVFTGAVDVRWFGAVWDGVTEDTNAIIAAIAAAGSKRVGGVVLLPPGGTYLIAGGRIKVTSSNITIVATGAKIKLKDSPTVNQGAMLQLGDYGNVAVRGTLKNIGIIGGEWDGNKANQKNGSTPTGNGDGGNSGIRMDDVDGIHLSRCVVKDCDGYGISTVGSFLPNRKNLRWEYCSVTGCHYDGFDIKAGLDGYVLFKCVSEYNGIGGNILNRDGMGFDMRGDNGEAIGCIARGNRSGNFRIRENAGLNLALTDCRSYDAPAGTYGYLIIGANTATYTLTDCTSFGDNIGLKHQRSNLVLVGGNIRNAITNGVLQQGKPQEIGQTTTAIPLAVGTVIVGILNVSPSSAINCGPYNNIIITDGTNSVTGLVTSVNGVTGELTLNVASFTGGAPVAVGATATILDIGSLSVNGTKVMYNGQDGYSLDAPEYKTNIIGGGADFNGRYGINNTKCALTVIGGSVKNNGQTSATKRGILHHGVAKRVVLRDVYLGDDQAIPTQGAGIQFSGTNTGSGLISGCDFTGNTSTPIQNSPPAGWRVRDCVGLATENTIVTPAFAVDSVGIKTFTVNPGLNKTALSSQVVAVLLRDTNVTDYECDTPKITGVSSTVVSGTINVRVASATVGATAKLSLTVDSTLY